jgi:hypothetical protein
MSADPSDRRAAYDAMWRVIEHLNAAESALDDAKALRVVNSIDADDPTIHRLFAAIERAQRYAHRMRHAAAAQVLWDVDVPEKKRGRRRP